MFMSRTHPMALRLIKEVAGLRRAKAALFALCVAAAAVISGYPDAAHAVPSMGRQTGYSCGRCHTVFPELTPFGRQFKLGAFAQSSSKWDERPLLERLPVSGVLQLSRTETRNPSAGGVESDEYARDQQWLGQVAGVYYGGRITERSGALIQYSWDGIEKLWGMEMFDARYADSRTLAGKEFTWGVTVNNNPTVSDIYNSTPAWGFPHTEMATEAMPAAPLLDMGLASQVAGIGAYSLWNELLYAEFALYRSARSSRLFRIMSLGVPQERILEGAAPYWRFALQREAGAHTFAAGTFGLAAKVLTDPDAGPLGSDRRRNIGLDAFYQYIQGPHIASFAATRIREKQQWTTAFGEGLVSNPEDTLTTLRLTGKYHYQRKWGGALQYFRVRGTTDDLLYNTGDALTGSASGSPNSKGYVAEVNYLPIQNIKLALRYTRYQEFNGSASEYMPGRNASDNDSMYLLAWLMF